MDKLNQTLEALISGLSESPERDANDQVRHLGQETVENVSNDEFGSLVKSKTPFYVGCVVLNHDMTKVLLGCRREDGIWTGPGGGAEVGETPRQAALRELWEEAGLRLSPSDLIDLPTIKGKNGKQVHCFLVHDISGKDASVLRDPDDEVSAWGWFSINQPLPEPMNKGRRENILNAIAKLHGMSKAISISDEIQGANINTNEYSIDDMASKDEPLREILEQVYNKMAYGEEPREWILDNGYKLSLVREDDGLFSGSVIRASDDPLGSEDRAFRIEKMAIPAIVQTLKMKGYVKDESTLEQITDIVETHESEWEGQEGTPQEQEADSQAFEEIEEIIKPDIHEDKPTMSFNDFIDTDLTIEEADVVEPSLESKMQGELAEVLDALSDKFSGDLHIHLHKALIALNGEELKKAKELPVGTVRQWGGIKYQKLGADNWVKVPEDQVKREQEASERSHKQKLELEEHKAKLKADLQAKKDGENEVKKPESSKEPLAEDPMESPGEKEKKVSNDLTPPPEENERFTKKGADVSLEDVDAFIAAFEKDYENITETLSELTKVGALRVDARLKYKTSLFNKMKTRKKDFTLNEISDVIGTRALTESIEDQKRVVDNVKQMLDVVDVSDDVEKARKGGYRAVHFVFKTQSGKLAELQVKTKNQQLFASFTHDNIYKGDEEVQNSKEVEKFTEELSQYLFEIDKGERKDSPEDRPQEPKILKERNITFDWNNLKKDIKNIPG